MAQVIPCLAVSSPVRAADAPGEALRVTIVAEPWAAPFTAAELASALRLRLPRAEVGLVAADTPTAGSRTSVRVHWLEEPRRGLRVERGSGDAVEFPLSDGSSASAEPVQVTRRAALVIALFAEEGAPLADAAPTRVEPAPGEPSGRAMSQDSALAVSSAQVVPATWALSAQLGPAVALEEDEIASTVALTVRGRRYVSPSAAVEVGAKLSGQYTAQIASQSVGVADRAFFAGVAYEAWLSRRLAVDLGAALQYTHPVVDVDGEGPVKHLDAPTSTRLAVRTGAGIVWSPGGHLTVGISATTAFSFRDREYLDDTGREVIGVGSMILDLAAGAGVRW